jgi:squalene-associated FAD-dependent desaturase
MMKADAVIIGGGVAGLSAAVRLAEAGRTVVVAEAAPRLGGRASSFVDRATGDEVDNGQHVIFGCYRDTYQFLHRIGSAHLAPLQPRLRLNIAGRGRMTELACPALPPPWHLIAGVLRWSAVPFRDRLAVRHLAPLIARAKRIGAAAAVAEVPAGDTVEDWLRRHRQPAAVCEWLWHPLAFAALNESPAVAAARPFVRVLAELFGPRLEDSAVALPSASLRRLFAEPARAFVEARGGRVLLGSPACIGLDDAGAVSYVLVKEGRIAADIVVAAVPWHAFADLWPGAVPRPVQQVAGAAAEMASSPIVTVNLWLDRPRLARPFVGLVGGPMHWVFDKGSIVREPATHLSVVASAAGPLASADNLEITRMAMAQLAATLPDFGEPRLLRSVVVRERRATFSVAPGSPGRPAAATAIPGLFLAGDWTDTGLPATIEGAVRSGHAAADLGLRARRHGTVRGSEG